MKLEDQVCSLELAKRLKELGVKQESLCHWYQGVGGEWYLGDTAEMMNNAVEISHMTAPQFNSASAFTVAELGEMLPRGFASHKYGNNWYSLSRNKKRDTEATTEADARAKMLIYLLENKLITA